MNLLDFVKVKNIFTEEVCSHAIEDHLAQDWMPHEWYDPLTQKRFTKDVDPYNNIFDDGFTDYLCNTIMDATQEYFNDLNQERSVNFLSRPRLNRYQQGQEMKLHPDHIQSLFDGRQKGIPIMSYILLLNNDFEGGDFEYQFSDGTIHTVDLKAGDLVMWPSLFLYPHRITPVTKGERISVVVWGW
jgi:predicted 2-oxoglutarate/Fe(II)-dependent dioxygenase YbiX